MATIFCHNVGNAYDPAVLAMVTNWRQYCSRAAALAYSRDVLCLNGAFTKNDLSVMEEHANLVGFEWPMTVLLTNHPSVSMDYPEYNLSPFAFTEAEHERRPDLRRLGATLRAENKNSFMELAQECGVPTPLTLSFETGVELLSARVNMAFPLVLKLARSASGGGVRCCASWNEVEAVVTEFDMGARMQLQQFVNGREASLLWFVESADQIRRVGATWQFVVDNAHEGNARADGTEWWDQVEPVIRVLAAQGFHGYIGVDFFVTDDGKLFVTECNARTTGAVYLAEAARRAGFTDWEGHNVTLPTREIPLEQIRHLLSRPGSREGLILTNFAVPDADKVDGVTKLTVVAGGDAQVRRNLFDELCAVVGAKIPASLQYRANV